MLRSDTLTEVQVQASDGGQSGRHSPYYKTLYRHNDLKLSF